MSEQSGRILIVDDDPDFSESTAAFLEMHGFEVERSCSGTDGLRAARSEPPDVIVMDVMMEERTAGFFTVQQLRREERLAGIPVIMVSSIYEDDPAFGIPPEKEWLRHDAFLSKPLDLDALLKTVTDLLSSRPVGRAP